MIRFIVIIGFLVVASLSYADCIVQSFFSPYDNVEAVVINNIIMADSSIHCSLYGIENQKITDAMKAAISKKIDVKLCLDKMQAAGKSSTHKQLQDAGAEIVIKPINVLNHNKFCVLDKNRVLMGSWNYSHSSSFQDNSMVVLSNCDDVVKTFEDAFQRIHDRDKR